ncbi:MAG: formylglycine-generating enzyme family protein [Nitrospirae bacterium]|nr:formylglycine-generating enzyme family protein [Nitrospirota bacterium]
MSKNSRPCRYHRFAVFILAIGTACGLMLTGCQREEPTPIGMVRVPAGPFTMGSDEEDTEGKTAEFGMVKPLYQDEHPAHTVTLPTYFIDQTEVTIAQYKKFIEATGARPPADWKEGKPPEGRDNYPASGMNWYDADRYCTWAGKQLPAEAEWEKAARGPNGLSFPWGNEFDPKKANTGGSGLNSLAPVGSFPQGRSPYGADDMAGNVWEWTADWYQAYPGSSYQSPAFGQKTKVLRGGSWGGAGHYALSYFYRTSHRLNSEPEFGFPDAGFRCAKRAR